MKTFRIKAKLARWTALRLEDRARALRGSLRSYQRKEAALIRKLNQRDRGLRLYAAWIENGSAGGMVSKFVRRRKNSPVFESIESYAASLRNSSVRNSWLSPV